MRRTRLTLLDLESRLVPATFTVTSAADSGPGTLRAALTAADARPGPDTVVFRLPSGSVISLTSGELTSKGDVTITGPGPGKLIIDGETTSRAFDIDDGVVNGESPATITGLSVIRGNAQAFGGGIYSTESLTLKNVVVSDCVAGEEGGGVCVGGTGNAVANISGCTFVDNTASGNYTFGGGLDISLAKAYRIVNVTATGNSALFGGGIYAFLASAGANSRPVGIISQCKITDNRAVNGAGIMAQGFAPESRTSIRGLTVAHNTSAQTGGGLEVDGYNLSISDSTITNNTASWAGGGLSAAGLRGPLTISGCTISGNTTTTSQAGYAGAGIFIQGNGSAIPVTVSASRIADNRSIVQGGGLFADNGIELAVSGCKFTANSAGQVGGGISTTGTGTSKVDLTVTQCSFVGNAGSNGGAIDATGDGEVTVASSTVTGNTAYFSGGALFIDTTGPVTIRGLVATGNAAQSGFAGAVDVLDTTNFRILGGRIDNNSAGWGGGIDIYDASGSITGVAVSGNTALYTGGGVEHGGTGTVILQAKLVTGNTAPVGSDVHGTFTLL